MALTIIALVLALLAFALAFALALPLWIPLVAALVMLLPVLAHLGLKRYRAARASRAIERSIAAQAEQFEKRARPDQQAQARALALQFEEALRALKSSRLAKGREGALYALPWYVIIGPPGAGKSTAIRESGLQFPLLGAQGSVRGIGGTRNCDWWLTNEAILLDTAGRYAVADDDRDEWLSFLDLLRRARPKRPLNGLLVAVSVVELAGADERAVQVLAERIRERIDEVNARLELRLPVYVVLTKCDLVPGFVESFEELRKSERGQVLGFTLPVSRDGELAASVEQEWTKLVQVVERRSVLRIAEARGLEARRAVFEFPQHLASLKPAVSAFMSALFIDNVYRDAPIARGLYLTSGTQEGSPVDRLMGAMAAAFGLPPRREDATARAEQKSYFLTDLFRGVMFPDSDLVRRSQGAERRARIRSAATAATLALLAVSTSAFALRSYLWNRNAVAATQRELSAAMTHGEDARGRPIPLALLEPLRTRLAELRRWSNERPPWRVRAGLYQGDALLPHLQTFYTSALRRVLMEPLLARFEQPMRESLQMEAQMQRVPSPDSHARLYAQLRAYLLLTQPKEKSEPPLDDELKSWLTRQLVETWAAQHELQASPAERRAMTEHVAAYLDLLAADPELGFARAPELVRGARELLARIPMAKLAVDRLVAEIEPLGLELTLSGLTGAVGLPLSASGQVRGAFTRRGFETAVRPRFQQLPQELLGDAWVLETRANDGRTDEARSCALRSEYFARFIDEWRTFVGTLRMEEPQDHARALVVLQDLTRGQPAPLERVLRGVAYNAELRPTQPSEGSARELAEKAAEQAVEKSGLLDQLRSKVSASPLSAGLVSREACRGGDYLTEESVRRALRGFYSFGASTEPLPEGAPPPITAVQTYQEQLIYLRDALQAYVDDPSAADPMLSRLSGARMRVRNLIETQEVGWRPRFDALLWPPVNGAATSSTAALAGEKGQRWCTSVALPFARTLTDRYPFAKQGQDASLADLADFYRPVSGVLWSFYEAVLKRDVAQLGERFEPQRGAGVGAMYSEELIRFLQRSQVVSRVLFPPGADRPRVDFEVRVRPSPGVAQVHLTVDGQTVEFHNGPEQWHRLTWPGDEAKQGASLRVRGAHMDETLVQDGEWGLFRLLEKGTVSAAQGERFVTARWRLRTQNDVTVDIRPARVDNPFIGHSALLEPFRADGVRAPRSATVHAKACVE